MKRRGAVILTALALSLTLLPGCAAWYGYNVPDTAVGEHGVMTGALADKLEEPLYFVLLNHEDNRWYLFKLGYGGGPYDLGDFEIGDELYIEYYMSKSDDMPRSSCVKIMPLEEYEANRERVDAKRAETYARQRGDREEGRP